MKTNLKTTHT